MTEHTAARKFSGTKVLTIFLSVSSATAIVLALLGYGVALSAEASFGIPHAVVFNSTSDLLTLGGWAVMQMLLMFSKLSRWGFYVSIWETSWAATKMIVAMIAVLIVLGGIAFAAQYFLRRWAWLHNAAEQVRGSTRNKLLAMAGFLMLLLAAPLVVMPVTTLAMVIGLMSMAALLSIVPMAGLQAGQAHIDDWVVGPSVCSPLKSRGTRLQAQPPVNDGKPKTKVSTCVTVKKTDGTEYRGRVVFATFNAIVLYNPEAGSVRRVSTDGASVEVIDTL